jgi:hypothetical protein
MIWFYSLPHSSFKLNRIEVTLMWFYWLDDPKVKKKKKNKEQNKWLKKDKTSWSKCNLNNQ